MARRCSHVYGGHKCSRAKKGTVALIFPPHGPAPENVRELCEQHIREVTQYPPGAGEWKVER